MTHKINLDLNSTNFDGKKTILESIYFVGFKLKLSLKSTFVFQTGYTNLV
jgi:hypothetical protein